MFQGNFCVWFVNKWWNGSKQLDRRPCNRHNQFTWFFTCFIWFLSFNFLFSFCQSRSFHLIGTTKKCINVSIIWRTRTRPLRRSCPLEVGTLEAKSFLIWSVSVVTEKYSLTLLWGKKLITWSVMSSQLEKGKFSSDPFKGFIFLQLVYKGSMCSTWKLKLLVRNFRLHHEKISPNTMFCKKA